MALIKARLVTKCAQYMLDNCKINTRMLSATKALFNTNTVTGESKTEPENIPPLSVTETKLKFEMEHITKEIDVLKEKNDEMTDKYKRALADGENLRIRMLKQVQDAKIFGIQNFCKDLLEVSDVLSKAIESVPAEEIAEKNPHLKSLYEGLVMTEAQLTSVFKRHGLEIVNPLNEKFNPNLHEALFQQDVPGKEPGTVVVVSKTGYKLQERVIRPALVGVSK